MNKEQVKFHKSRRDQLMKKIGKDSIAIILSNSLRNKSHDVSYKFKQNNNFYYLTGFDEPNSILVLAPGGVKVKDKKSGKESSVKEVLFVQHKDPFMEKWDGIRLGSGNVREKLGIEYGMDNSSFAEIINNNIIYKYDRLFINLVELYDAEGELKEVVSQLISMLRVVSSIVQISDVNNIIGVMRKIKTSFELKQIQKAIDITVDSLKDSAMKLRPGMKEYQLQSLIEYNYKNRGASEIAFDTIVASGNNACTLHYITNRDDIKNGDLVLIDTGAEYNYYRSDITRTFPANGKFTKEQRIVYEIVLKANKEAIKRIKPGVKFSTLNKEIKDLIANELVKRKIIKKKEEVKNFVYHGLGHDLGLDTHDAVPFTNGKKSDFDTLKEGYLVTIEPGVYFSKDSKETPSKFKGIGVRIEDDVLVTKTGCKVLTSKLVKEAEEVERLVSN